MAKKTAGEPDTLSFNEACAALGISRATMYRRIAQGRIVPIRSAALDRQKTRFLRSEIERIGRGQRDQPAP